MKKRFFILLGILAVTISFGIATQLYAYMARYAPTLGTPHLGPIYQPFHLVWWLITLQATALITWTTIGTAAAGSLASTITLMSMYYKTGSTPSGDFGSSRWAKESELKELGLFAKHGVVLGQNKKAVTKQNRKGAWKPKRNGKLLRTDGPEHTLVTAPTRRGKGISIVIPSLLAWRGSLLCYDIKGENYETTGNFRSKFSYVLRFAPAHDKNTMHWNPLDEIEKGPKEVAQTQALVSILTNPDGKSESNHFDRVARNLFEGAILHVLYDPHIKERSLRTVYNLLTDPERPVDDTLKYMLEAQHTTAGTHPGVAAAAREMLDKPEKERGSVLSTVQGFLTIYHDPIVAENTSYSDLTATEIMNLDKPVSLYYVVNQGEDAERMKPLTRLFLNTVTNKLTNRSPGDYKHRLMMLIDEFPTLGSLPFFESQLAFTAGYGIKTVIIAQSFNQIFAQYTERTSILDNCKFKVILGADSANESELIAKMLGQQTVNKTTKSRSARAGNFFHGQLSTSESETGTALIQADEIFRLKYSDILLSIGGTYPYTGKKIFFYADKRFKELAGGETPDISKELKALEADQQRVKQQKETPEQDSESKENHGRPKKPQPKEEHQQERAIEEEPETNENQEKSPIAPKEEEKSMENEHKEFREEQEKKDEALHRQHMWEDVPI